MSKEEETKLLVEAWKQVVQTQMHFNDLGLRIRNFAFLLTGAFIALGGYAIREGGSVIIFSLEISIASAIIFASILPLLGVFFMDRMWYHPLLLGAVIEGSKIEKELVKRGIPLGLGNEISWQSGSLNYAIGQVKLFTDEERDRYTREKKIGWLEKWEERDGKYVLKEGGRFELRSFRSQHKMNAFYSVLIVSMIIVGLAISKPADKNAQPEPQEVEISR